MSASVFISYASQDQKVANTLCKALEGRGFNCWIASRNIAPGENFQIAIVRAIRSAKIMLLVFTGNSNNSEEMAKELALASQSRLIVVPLRIEDVRQNDAFAYEFATRQWIDFFADWETAMEQLAHRISVALATEAPPAAPPPAAEAAMPGPTPDVIAQAFADQPAAAAAPMPAAPVAATAGQTLVEPGGKTAVMSAAALAAAAPVAAAAIDVGPSSFKDAPVKRGAPVVLIVTLSLLVIVMIAGAAVILPSFLTKKPTPPPIAAAPANTVTALTTTPAPPPTPALVTQPTAATPGPAPMASGAPAAPTTETPVQPSEIGPPQAEDPDLDPETHRSTIRSGRRHGGGGGGGSSGGGGSPDVPF